MKKALLPYFSKLLTSPTDDLVNSFFTGHSLFSDPSPSFKIDKQEDKVLVRADLPGYEKENIKITVKDGVLTVEGENKTEEKDENIWKSSIQSFSESWELPAETKIDEISADVKSGILVITVPLEKKAAPREVKIRVG